MQKLTYRQAYDKIIEAYFKDEIKPFDPKFCFCGTLHNNKNTWCTSKPEYFQRKRLYSKYELIRMEDALLTPFLKYDTVSVDINRQSPGKWYGWIEADDYDDFEETLFTGMCAALEVLKQIHRERNENVDEDIPAFTKRELA